MSDKESISSGSDNTCISNKSLPKVLVKNIIAYYVECPHCEGVINYRRWFEEFSILTEGINKDTGKEVECPICETRFLLTGFSD